MRAYAALLLLVSACAASDKPAEEPAPPEHGQTGGMCGGIAGFQCGDEGDFCAYEPGACVSIADAAGVCKPRPQMCTKEYRPVCGCDGKTYGNACDAASNGVSIAYDGECKEE